MPDFTINKTTRLLKEYIILNMLLIKEIINSNNEKYLLNWQKGIIIRILTIRHVVPRLEF